MIRRSKGSAHIIPRRAVALLGDASRQMTFRSASLSTEHAINRKMNGLLSKVRQRLNAVLRVQILPYLHLEVGQQ